MHTHAENFETEELEAGNQTINEFITFFRDIIIILLIVLFIRGFLVTPFRINGSSMETSYHDKEYILVDKVSYLDLPVTYSGVSTEENLWNRVSSNILKNIPVHIGDPKRGDVVVITPHVDISREYYIKRVIGLPNDIIRFDDGNVFIKKNGSDKFVQLNEPYLSLINSGQTRLPQNVESNQFTVPEGYYWVMGDNRQNSADSRACFKDCMGRDISSHFIKRKDIVGKVLLNFGYFNIFNEGGLLSNGKLTWTHPPRFLSHPRNASYPELGE